MRTDASACLAPFTFFRWQAIRFLKKMVRDRKSRIFARSLTSTCRKTRIFCIPVRFLGLK